MTLEELTAEVDKRLPYATPVEEVTSEQFILRQIELIAKKIGAAGSVAYMTPHHYQIPPEIPHEVAHTLIQFLTAHGFTVNGGLPSQWGAVVMNIYWGAVLDKSATVTGS